MEDLSWSGRVKRWTVQEYEYKVLAYEKVKEDGMVGYYS